MKVKELIEELSKYPPDLEVEPNNWDISTIEIVELIKTEDGNSYVGIGPKGE